MANEPITREEMLLNAVATGEAANLEPITREEMFLAKLGGADVNTPTPITRKEQFLQKAIEGGGSGGGTIEPLSVTENGIYTASEGVDGYSPIVVNVAAESDADEPYTTITVTAKKASAVVPDAYVEATKGGASVSGITDETGVCVLKIPYSLYQVGGSGTWTISASKDGSDVATGSVYVSFFTFTSTVSLFYATVRINCETGATVTLAKDGNVQTATAEDNKATFEVGGSGEYTATVDYNGTVLTKIVTVSTTKGAVYSHNMFATHLSLEDTDWSRISAISAEGTPENYFAVGDTKSVYLSGQVGGLLTLDETLYVYILGFNHNADYEGNGIHFGCFKTAGGIDVALVDSAYGGASSSTSFNFRDVEASSTGNYSRNMKKNILGDGWRQESSDESITSPTANTLMAALPSDLRAVLKEMKKHNSQHTLYEYLALPGAFEIFTESAAQNMMSGSFTSYQQRYAYYVDGASAIKYKHSDPSTACIYWLRDIATYYAGYPMTYGSTSGSLYYTSEKKYSYGVSPIFMV